MATTPNTLLIIDSDRETAGRLREEGGRAVLDGRPLDEPVIVEADS